MKYRTIVAYLLSSTLLIVAGISSASARPTNFQNSVRIPAKSHTSLTQATSLIQATSLSQATSLIQATSFTHATSLTHTTSPSKSSIVTFPGPRPFELHLPAVYISTKPAPLIISLHGYTSSGANQEKYFKLASVASARGILYVAPDGSLDNAGKRFWNATPACCNFYGSTVDDEAYIVSIIDSVSKSYNVDAKRIYIVGHSNGGFMTHHMACTHSNLIAAVASFSGATFKDQSVCTPSEPISVLQIWGTSDETISYDGGAIVNPYPGALETISDWAKLDKCTSTLTKIKAKINLEATILGAETTVSHYQGCAKKTTVELWSIAGGYHVPKLVPDFATRLINFLLAHPKVQN